MDREHDERSLSVHVEFGNLLPPLLAFAVDGHFLFFWLLICSVVNRLLTCLNAVTVILVSAVLVKLESNTLALLAELGTLVLDLIDLLSFQLAKLAAALEVLKQEETALSNHNNAFPCVRQR